MREKIVTFAETVPAAFWVLAAAGFYFLYRIPAVLLAGESLPAQALLFVVLTLAVVILTLWTYSTWDFGLKPDTAGDGFSIACLLLLPVVGELMTTLCVAPVSLGRLFWLIVYSIGRGTFEAVLFLGVLMTHMMRTWNGREFRGVASGITAGLLAAMACVIDIMTGKIGAEVMVQALTIFALVFGLSAVFIRTRNLWPCMVVLILHYFAAGLYRIYEQGADGMLPHAISSHGFLQLFTVMVSAFMVILGLGIAIFLLYLEMDEGEDERWHEARWDPIPATEMDEAVIFERQMENKEK